MKIQQNILLKKYTSFKIGGVARYFLIIENKQDLIKAIEFSKEKNLPYFILGGGTNVLISDNISNKIIIKINNIKLEVNNNIIKVGAGVLLKDLVKLAVRNELSGLEWAIGIPGTVGGAVRGNVGAFGHSISEIVKEIIILKNNKEKIYNSKDCKFKYRDSIFKHNKDIIFSIKIKVKKSNNKIIYPEQKRRKNLIKSYLDQRKNKIPLKPSAGCIFKNPKPLIASDLIEQCGLKGKQIGDAMVSKKHANFIINLNNAKSDDVIKLIKLIKNKVYKKFNIKLEEEIEIIHS